MGRGRRAGRVRPASPQRRCVGCKAQRPGAALLRLAVAGGQVVPDPEKVLPGRGCSICREEACAKAAIKTRGIGRALKGKAQDPAIDRLLDWVRAARFA